MKATEYLTCQGNIMFALESGYECSFRLAIVNQKRNEKKEDPGCQCLSNDHLLMLYKHF